MDPVVTARVPEHVRTRGVEVLREIGSNTSELVNSAFAYVIRERKLPKAHADMNPGVRTLSAEQMRELEAFIQDVKVPTPSSWEAKPFDQLFDEAMEDRYADLR